MVGKDRRLTKKAEFQRLTKKGSSWACSLLVMKALPNSLPASRFGFSVGKAVGNAVSRNRAKRQLRESIRRFHLRTGWDILVIARPAIAGSKFADIERAMAQLLERANLLEIVLEDIGAEAD